MFDTAQHAGAAVSGLPHGRRGGLTQRLSFSCMCAVRVPVAPAVGAVPLCLVRRWHRGRCDVRVLVKCLYSGLVGGLPCMARVAWLASLVGWRLLCVPLVVSCSSSCLIMHSEPSRIFVGQFLLAYAFLTIHRVYNSHGSQSIAFSILAQHTPTSPLPSPQPCPTYIHISSPPVR